MKKNVIFLFCFLLVLITGISQELGNNDEKLLSNSKILRFRYGGYGDTIFAFLGGRLYAQKGGSMIPLSNVDIIVSPNPKRELYYVYLKDNPNADVSSFNFDTAFFKSNDSCFFQIPFLYGKYNIFLDKTGYQKVILENYEADPDQFSSTEILMVEGKDTVKFDVSKKNYKQ